MYRCIVDRSFPTDLAADETLKNGIFATLPTGKKFMLHGAVFGGMSVAQLWIYQTSSA
jgi:hypothetical protein